MLSKVFQATLLLSLTLLTTTVSGLTTTTATLFQYPISASCTGSQVTSSQISLNQCIDIGAQANDASIELLNLVVGTDIAEGAKCYGQVYEYAGCGTSAGDPTAGSFWRQGMLHDDGAGVCFEKPSWADGQSAMGSVELVCV